MIALEDKKRASELLIKYRRRAKLTRNEVSRISNLSTTLLGSISSMLEAATEAQLLHILLILKS